MNELNATNRSVYISDNLAFLKALNTGTVDLVCIDPPFAKNETFGRKNRRAPDPLKPPLTEAERQTELDLMARWGIRTPEDADRAGINWPETAYKDFWSWEKDVHEEWLRDIENNHPAIASLIEATRQVHSDSTAAYLCYMAVRLFEIRRVLKDTGSLYLHCDHTAGAYLRQLLDGIFGRGNFRNEIAWKRHSSNSRGSQHTPKTWGNATDTILFYAKSDAVTVRPYLELTEEEVKAKFNRVDENGYRYYDDSAHIWRTPNMGARPNLCYEWRGFRNPHPSGWRLSKERLEEEYQRGNIVILPNGRLQRRMYFDDFRGTPMGNFWDTPLPASTSERTGYPTQKPVALAERIVKASCPDGGVVLDCFAGMRLRRSSRRAAGAPVDSLRHQPPRMDCLQTPVRQATTGPVGMPRADGGANGNARQHGRSGNSPRT